MVAVSKGAAAWVIDEKVRIDFVGVWHFMQEMMFSKISGELLERSGDGSDGWRKCPSASQPVSSSSSLFEIRVSVYAVHDEHICGLCVLLPSVLIFTLKKKKASSYLLVFHTDVIRFRKVIVAGG